jgi:hypothetical protein
MSDYKEYNFGGTIVRIYSPLAKLSDEERAKWMLKEQAAGNPKIKRIEEAVRNCFRPSQSKKPR